MAVGPNCSTIGNMAWKVSQERIMLADQRSRTDRAASTNDCTGPIGKRQKCGPVRAGKRRLQARRHVQMVPDGMVGRLCVGGQQSRPGPLLGQLRRQ